MLVSVLQASSLAPVMQNYLALASNGDFTYQPQAAAHAKMLAGIATAYINPLAGVYLLPSCLSASLHNWMSQALSAASTLLASCVMRTILQRSALCVAKQNVPMYCDNLAISQPPDKSYRVLT